jgi:hypothetical protein
MCEDYIGGLKSVMIESFVLVTLQWTHQSNLSITCQVRIISQLITKKPPSTQNTNKRNMSETKEWERIQERVCKL